MKIIDLLSKDAVLLNSAVGSKAEAIDNAIRLMEGNGNITDPEKYRRAVLAREASGTTGIGEGIAIPHAKTDAVSRPGLSAQVVPAGVDFEALDGQPVHLIFLIAAPDSEDNIHLDVLARLSALLVDEGFREQLIAAESPESFLELIDKAETARMEKLAAKAAAKSAKAAAAKAQAAQEERPLVLAVTACPTGIAHTYMAAENLENAAREMGVDIKVETNGSGGVKNKLTPQEIARCAGVIIAADKQVETARFEGRQLLATKVADGISRPKELIQTILDKKAPTYSPGGHEAASPAPDGEGESVGRRVYKDLMNGVSHMLPFVVGGGILTALAFLLDGANAGTAIFGNGTPAADFCKTVGGLAFDMMFPILAGFIAMSIGDRPALMVGLVGGLIAKGGGSGFFGALIAGFAGGWLIVGLRRLFDRLPKALEGTKPVLLYPFFGLIIMGAGMTFLVNPPVAAFNQGLYAMLDSMGGVSKVLLGLTLGGMMSIDFGGPLNKAAYVFGTASIATGQTQIMAAVMAGGMVPPLAIALATTFFRSRFTRRECQTSVTNYIMGASFITEGAIPFAASDPLRVIPACAVGSALAGGLSMFFGCGSMAPHGGLFVLGIIENPLMYLLSVAAGSIVGMLLLALLKRPLPEDAR